MDNPYSSEFYALQQLGSLASAEIVVPHVLALFDVSSVVDVGCGVGTWLQVFDCYGIKDYLGVDGNHVPRDLLKIPSDKFLAADLTTLRSLDRKFDLVCCVEVAEHLPPEYAREFIALLARLAPIILFSAALPGQGGTAHLNEQWPTYWASLFAAHEYVAVDCIRPSVYGNQNVDWWYRQNLLIFCAPEKCPTGYRPATAAYELNRVDPAMVRRLIAEIEQLKTNT
jgi:SAM-dependent methyltransferase